MDQTRPEAGAERSSPLIARPTANARALGSGKSGKLQGGVGEGVKVCRGRGRWDGQCGAERCEVTLKVHKSSIN